MRFVVVKVAVATGRWVCVGHDDDDDDDGRVKNFACKVAQQVESGDSGRMLVIISIEFYFGYATCSPVW